MFAVTVYAFNCASITSITSRSESSCRSTGTWPRRPGADQFIYTPSYELISHKRHDVLFPARWLLTKLTSKKSRSLRSLWEWSELYINLAWALDLGGSYRIGHGIHRPDHAAPVIAQWRSIAFGGRGRAGPCYSPSTAHQRRSYDELAWRGYPAPGGGPPCGSCPRFDAGHSDTSRSDRACNL